MRDDRRDAPLVGANLDKAAALQPGERRSVQP
jgi:hypothetical protein